MVMGLQGFGDGLEAPIKQSFFNGTVMSKGQCAMGQERCVAASRRECGRGACKREPEGLRALLQVPLAARGLLRLSLP